MTARAIVLLGLSASLLACGATASGEAGTPPPSEPRRPPAVAAALEAMSIGSRGLESAVDTVVTAGDASARQEADQRLAVIAEHVLSAAWLEKTRPELEAANAAARLQPTPKQLEAQLAMFRAEQHVAVLRLMLRAGGDRSLSHCRRVAASAEHPPEVRAVALDVVQRWVPLTDARALRAEIDAARADAASEGAQGRGAAATVAQLRPAFKGCWDRHLATTPRPENVRVRMTVKVLAAGDVGDIAISGSEGAAFVSCLTEVARATRFPPPDGGGATIIVPLSFFLPEDP